MNCPRCQVPLSPLVTSGVVVDFCSTCRGTFLDKGEARYFASRPDLMDRALAEPLVGERHTGLRCPRCSGELLEGGLGQADLLLDRCGECEGLWFDKGELGRLKEQGLLRGLDPERAKPAAPKMEAFFGAVQAASAAPPVGIAARSTPGFGTSMVFAVSGLAALLFLGLVLLVELAQVPPLIALGVGLAVTALHFFVAPWFLDFFLRRFQSLRWVQPHELPPHLGAFITRACGQANLRFPKVGIIEDGSPNAFTYGRSPSSARLVFTRGLLDLLEEDEREAVAAHELGHIKHWDVVVMTLLGVVPLVLYTVYRTLIRVRIRGKNGGQAQLAAYAAALVAFLLYIVSEYLVLFVSRAREYGADRFAARLTGNPNALSRALVKIAYGLATQRADELSSAEGEKKPQPISVGQLTRAMGIFDPGAAAQLCVSSYANGAFSRENLVAAMQWDLWNPWAGYFELHSTHPLPAKRICRLSEEAVARNQQPLVVFDLQKPESYWDEFLVDLGVKALPLLGILLGLCAAWLRAGRELALGLHLLGPLALGYGLGFLLRTFLMYQKRFGFMETSVSALLRQVKVSPVRGIPARLRGRIIGRGEPGLVWNEDSVLRDRTGLVYLDYRQPIRPLEWIFGLWRNRQLIGEEAVAEGWFRRGPGPYIELSRIISGGVIHTCYVRHVRYLWGALCAAAGLWLVL